MQEGMSGDFIYSYGRSSSKKDRTTITSRLKCEANLIILHFSLVPRLKKMYKYTITVNHACPFWNWLIEQVDLSSKKLEDIWKVRLSLTKTTLAKAICRSSHLCYIYGGMYVVLYKGMCNASLCILSFMFGGNPAPGSLIDSHLHRLGWEWVPPSEHSWHSPPRSVGSHFA